MLSCSHKNVHGLFPLQSLGKKLYPVACNVSRCGTYHSVVLFFRLQRVWLNLKTLEAQIALDTLSKSISQKFGNFQAAACFYGDEKLLTENSTLRKECTYYSEQQRPLSHHQSARPQGTSLHCLQCKI